MATDRLKPGEVIGSALEIYGAQVWVLIPAAIAVFAILAVARVIFTGAAGALVSILSIILTTFYQGMVVELVRDVQDGRRDSSVGQLFGSVAPIVLPLIGLSLVVGLGVVVGFVLLIVPGIYLMTIWAVAAPSFVIERRGVFAAIGRSRELVKGHGWQVLGVIAVILVLALLTGIVVGELASGLGNGGVAVVQWAATVIVSPFTALVSAVMYFSLRRLHGEAVATSGSLAPQSERPGDPPSFGL
jgi:MFS family permease